MAFITKISDIHPPQKALQAKNNPASANSSLSQNRTSMEEYKELAVQAYHYSEKMKTQVSQLNAVIQKANEGKYTHSFLMTQLGYSIETELFNTLCCIVSPQGDAKEGKHLLEKDFQILLQLKDNYGNNPLEAALIYLERERDSSQTTANLYDLLSILSALETESDPTRISMIKSRALSQFKVSSPETQKLLCCTIWELDGRPPGFTYGYDAIVQDIGRLYRLRKICPIKACMGELERKRDAHFQFITTYRSEEKIRPSDSPAICQHVRKLNQLEQFRLFLLNPRSDRSLFSSRYRQLPTEFKQLLAQVAWICSYQPNELDFGNRFLEQNPCWLVKTRTQGDLDILLQLISHESAKIKLLRREQELQKFFQEVGSMALIHNTLLSKFNALSEPLKEGLRHKVWYEHGGKSDPNFGGIGYGTRTIEQNALCLYSGKDSLVWSYYLDLVSKREQADSILLGALKQAKALPADPLDVSTNPLFEERGLMDHLPENLRVVHVTAEYKGVANAGGLGTAVQGMIQGFGSKDARVILPLYQGGPISQDLLQTMKETDYPIYADGQKIKVFKVKVKANEVDPHPVSCYLIDAPHVFTIPKKEGGLAGDIYGGDHDHKMRKWSIFQSAATDLCYLFSQKAKPFQILQCHDAQTGRVPKLMKERHFEEWISGNTPGTLFTYHNNIEQVMLYGENSFVEGIRNADAISTVSLQFGKESQGKALGRGVDGDVRKAAFEGKLFGVVNGNSIGFNPAKDAQLGGWTNTHGHKIDLKYGPHLDSGMLANQLRGCQEELCAYLRGLRPGHDAYADLNPEKPIVMYVGRYDSFQKGIDKLPMIMEETLRLGGQFICVGPTPENDDRAKEYLATMKQLAKKHNHKGVLVLEDDRKNGKFIHQGVFGNLLRAAATLGVFPSSYEPCGLVQGEFFCFGKKVIATETGGFADTIDKNNGYLFKRRDNWYSQEQDAEICNTLRSALEWASGVQRALYHGTPEQIEPYMAQMKRTMEYGLNSTWENNPDGSPSPVVRIERIYAKALQQRALRGGAGYVELKILTL